MDADINTHCKSDNARHFSFRDRIVQRGSLMPKLLLFAPCERVIVEQGSNTVSLISVLQEITVGPAEKITSNTVAPTAWYVLSMWHREESEPVTKQVQRLIVESPNGKTLVEVFTEFDMAKGSHRNIALIQGLPIGDTGRYVLRLALKTDKGDWSEIATYPFTVKHSVSPTHLQQ